MSEDLREPAAFAVRRPAPAGLAALLADDPRGVLLRPLIALVADELGRQRGRRVAPAEWTGWRAGTPVDEEGLGVDSLARLELVARVNRAFQLHLSGVEDYLLIERTLGGWCDIVAAGYGRLGDPAAERLAFDTSGSTGAPRTIVHRAAHLLDEVAAQPALFPGIRRVVSVVPPHHIYGFLFGVLGPALHGWPVVDRRAAGPGSVVAGLSPGDLVVATPFHWSLILRSGASMPPGVAGVASGAPAPPDLWSALAKRGLGRLVEIYGSTETAGIGIREAAEADFALLPHLAGPAEGLEPIVRRIDGTPVAPPDRLEPTTPGRFRVAGRRDAAVQVGGVNVFPARVRNAIAALDLVADCAVRPDGEGAGARLKAFVVPADAGILGEPVREDAFRRKLRAAIAACLSDPERPARLNLGPRLPRTEMGKLADWS